MESNKNDTSYSKEMVDEVKPFKQSENIENLNYLYPNGHRITHQMRWLKISKDSGFKSDVPA
tara:strand:+ start:274 stop:459 length:186 start_codon:yes stop_codon:yes gene_type:complete